MKRQGSASKKTTTTSRVSKKTSASAVSTSRMASTMTSLSSSAMASRSVVGSPSSTSTSTTATRAVASSTAKRSVSTTATRRVNSVSLATGASDMSISIAAAPAAPSPVVAPSASFTKTAAFAPSPTTFKGPVADMKPSTMKIHARAVAPSMKKVTPSLDSVAVPSTAGLVAATPAFRASFKALDREAQPQSLSPQKIVFQAQKFIMNDVSGLQKEFKTDLNDTLDNLGIQVTVNEDGIITATFKRRGFDVEAVFDREFQFPDEDEFEDEYDENDPDGQPKRRGGSGSGSENEDYDDDNTPEPYHNITFSLMKDGQTLKMGGTLGLDGDLRITSFTPYTKRGEELRTVATEDLSDATLNALFDALEMICLQDETTNVLLDVARQERVKTHIDALTWMNEFFDLGDYN